MYSKKWIQHSLAFYHKAITFTNPTNTCNKESNRRLKPNPKDIPMKKKGFKNLNEDITKIRELLKKEGPCQTKKIQEFTGIARVSIQRRLNFMKDQGLIVRDKRKWMLTSYKEDLSPEKYPISLRHNEMIVRGILAINEYLPQFIPANDLYRGDLLTGPRKQLRLRSYPEMWQYALQHLKTGYPDIFDLYEECEVLSNKIQFFAKIESQQALEDILVETPADLNKGIDNQATVDIKLTEKEKDNLENETAEKRFELENRLSELIWRVHTGQLLNGKCSQCQAP